MAAVAVGDRVETVHDKKTVYGVVRAVRGNTATMVADGGQTELKGPVGIFKPSSHPLAKDKPNLMDKYGVVKYKALKVVDEPGGYNAEITLDGKKVLQAFNQGTGGPDNFITFTGVERKVIDQFYKDAEAWCQLFGYKEPGEAAGLWVEWYVNYRPYGVTGEAYITPLAQNADENAKLRAETQKKHDDEEKAAADEIGVKSLVSVEARDLKLPSRFKVKYVTNYGVIVDTVTGKGFGIGLCDIRGAIKAIAVLFPDEQPKT